MSPTSLLSATFDKPTGSYVWSRVRRRLCLPVRAGFGAALLVALLTGSAAPAVAQTPQIRQIASGAHGLELMPAEQRGWLIAAELARRDPGWGDSLATVRVVVRNPRCTRATTGPAPPPRWSGAGTAFAPA
jgi:hypothetical protein